MRASVVVVVLWRAFPIATPQLSFYLQQYSQFPYTMMTTIANNCQGTCGGTSQYCYNYVACYYGSATATNTSSSAMLGKDSLCTTSSTVMFATTTTSTVGSVSSGTHCWCPSTCTGTLSYDYIADSPIAGSPVYARAQWSRPADQLARSKLTCGS